MHTLRTLCASALLLASSAASASICDTLVLPHPAGAALDYQVVIGEARERDCSNPRLAHCRYVPAPRKQYGVCVRSRAPGQPWPVDWDFLPAPGCDGKDDSHTLRLFTGPGNDQVSAMLERYIEVADPWAPPPQLLVPMLCDAAIETTPGVIRNHTVGLFEMLEGPLLEVHLGAGRDYFYGSQRADTAYSNTRVQTRVRTSPFLPWTIRVDSPADHSSDVLCGMGGDDVLVGDRDPVTGTSSNHYETLIGNGGRNQCHGDVPPLFASVPSATGEAATDGADLLHCWHQRQGLPGRRADRNLCSLDLSNPKRWIERP